MKKKKSRNEELSENKIYRNKEDDSRDDDYDDHDDYDEAIFYIRVWDYFPKKKKNVVVLSLMIDGNIRPHSFDQ